MDGWSSVTRYAGTHGLAVNRSQDAPAHDGIIQSTSMNRSMSSNGMPAWARFTLVILLGVVFGGFAGLVRSGEHPPPPQGTPRSGQGPGQVFKDRVTPHWFKDN